MFPSASLLSCVVLALALQSTAAPLTLPQDFSNFTAIIPLYRSSALNATLPAGSLQNVLASDQTRARALLINAGSPVDAILAQAAPVSFSIVNALTVYTARVTSSSNTTYDLVVDTGSSNLWVGAGKPFHSSSTSKSTGKTFHVSYGSGEVEGMEWIEHISLAPQLAANGQSIGVATKSHGLEGYDGIIGYEHDLLMLSTYLLSQQHRTRRLNAQHRRWPHDRPYHHRHALCTTRHSLRRRRRLLLPVLPAWLQIALELELGLGWRTHVRRTQPRSCRWHSHLCAFDQE
jgi:hypothetical protein